MIPLRLNEKTGFLESNRVSGFDSVKKVRFLELAREAAENQRMPDVAALCRALGVGMTTYWEHMQVDRNFANAWEDIIDTCESSLVSQMYEYGKRPSGYMHMITWLRAKRPERWDPARKLIISRDSDGPKGLIDALKGAIDADIVGELKGVEGNAPASVPQADETH